MRRRRVIGSVTTFPAYDQYRAYVDGQITLEEWRNCDAPTLVVKPIYAEAQEEVLPPRWDYLAIVLLGVICFCLGFALGVWWHG